jgi:hypothetical protein
MSRREDIEARLADRDFEIPDDVQQTYEELQARIQEQLQGVDVKSSAAIVGESREERYARAQRLKAQRRELDRRSRYPMARRIKKSPITILAFIGISIMLCVISFFGGTLITNLVDQSQSPTQVANQFWSDIVRQDYGEAYNYLSARNDRNTQNFAEDANNADKALGAVKNASPSGDANGNTQTWQIKRKGGNKEGPREYNILLRFTYNRTAKTWQIEDYGQLFAIDVQDTGTPVPTN